MWFATGLCLFVLLSFSNGDIPIGGCSGTEYGCCPDGVTSASGVSFSGCRQRHVAPSQECQNFLSQLHPAKCATRTSCQDLECNYTIEGIRTEIEFDVHKCREPQPSVNMTLKLPSLDYKWSHDFSGNVSMIIPDLQLNLDLLHNWPFYVLIDVSVYRSNRDIHMSAAIAPVLVSVGLPPGDGFRLFRIILLEDSKLPINTSDCYGPPTCSKSCSDCLNGDDGWVCYKCPVSCSSGVSHGVCGSDMMSYSSECVMREKACEMKTALRVLYVGQCSSNPPTRLTLVTAWPPSLDNISSNTEEFVRDAVVFLVVSVKEGSVSIYTAGYFGSKLSVLLGYQVVVPRISKITRSRRLADDMIILNVTMYAHYHSSGSANEVIVPNAELVNALKQNRDKLEKTVNVQVVSIDRSYELQLNNSSGTGSGSSSKTTIIVVVTILVGILIAVAIVFVVMYSRRKSRACDINESNEDVINLPGKDQLALEFSTDDG
ncbi:uncharacterized protein LOC134189376 [Corticium candelabrum]|uniref:uncharacterized protein LOC134189376 n=1 Tax=Corticium candelabrum TaxID=121492 RepID=UPI002E26A0C7|nr:uncharacterized protein LOC134189376 [Corticium candelabrum]